MLFLAFLLRSPSRDLSVCRGDLRSDFSVDFWVDRDFCFGDLVEMSPKMLVCCGLRDFGLRLLVSLRGRCSTGAPKKEIKVSSRNSSSFCFCVGQKDSFSVVERVNRKFSTI